MYGKKHLAIFLFALICFLQACAPPSQDDQPAGDTMAADLEALTPHEIYGELLYDVQTAKLFADGKTFVDCVPKRDPQDIVDDYLREKAAPDFGLDQFVHANFDIPERKQTPPSTVSTVYKPLEAHLDSLWSVLQRPPDKPVRGSRIPLKYPYIVPGGRFTEVYYWDSYFTMLGLAESGEAGAIENMVKNFARLIDTYGFIPNGSRTYFLGRSQPPFFSLMVGILASLKGPEVWKAYRPHLLKEHAFWMRHAGDLSAERQAIDRVVLLDGKHMLNRYWDDFDGPRDESLLEDMTTARASSLQEAMVYKHLRAGAESGWDFSSRWFADGSSLSTIETAGIIPVDLNALLYNLELTIARASEEVGDEVTAAEFTGKAKARKRALLKYCWNDEAKFLVDYNFHKNKTTSQLSLAAMYPLCFNLVPADMAGEVAGKIEDSFLKPGGVISTLQHTGEQWDAPNGWAPLQWMTVWGLRNYGYDSLAGVIATRWTSLNKAVYGRTGKMMEKYNVEDTTLTGGGGEYPVQDGFGWTNGVYLKLRALIHEENQAIEE